MMLSFDHQLLAQTLIQDFLSCKVLTNTSFTKLAGDSSGKQFYRTHVDASSYIIIQIPLAGIMHDEYIAQTEKSLCTPAKTFIETGIMLAVNMPNVPAIYAVNEQQGIVVQSDHGDQTVEQYLLANKDKSRIVITLYEEIFRWIFTLQQFGSSLQSTKNSIHIFDQQALQCELNDFVLYTVCQGNRARLTKNSCQQLNQAFNKLAREVASTPVVLTHRDLHSKNIMLQQPHLTIIDFQDLCWGPVYYDFVSLIFDPYLHLPPVLQQALIESVWQQLQTTLNPKNYSKDAFLHKFYLTGIQRLLKAAGRYARLQYRDKKQSHIKYIMPAVQTAHSLLEQLDDWRYLTHILEDLTEI